MMLSAVIRQSNRIDPSCRIFVPFSDGKHSTRRTLGVEAALLSPRRRVGLLPFGGLNATKISRIVPTPILRTCGYARADDMRVHLDASGYAYGDPWGPNRVRRMSMLSSYWTREGQPYVVLPQAFGPFGDPAVAAASRRYLSDAKHVFARDRESYHHLRTLRMHTQHVSISPDFTLDQDERIPEWNPDSDKIAIIPNARFMDKAGLRGYIELMAETAQYLRMLKLDPEIVVHEDGDIKVARAIARIEDCKISAPESHSQSPNMLAKYRFIVACRYHAVVAALGSAVPSIAIGWSHKYLGLMEDYGVAEYCCSNPTLSEVTTLVNKMTESYRAVRGTLLHSRRAILQANEEMWNTAFRAVAAGMPSTQ